MIKLADQKEDQIVNDVMNALDRWYVAASSNGCLWIQPRQPVLNLLDFCTLLKRVRRVSGDHQFKSLVFHFEGVKSPRTLWLVILRLLTAFAKTMQTDCRIVRSIRVSRGEAERIAEVPESGSPSKRLIELNGVSVIIEPSASATRGICDSRVPA
jgi:hypothetical protein